MKHSWAAVFALLLVAGTPVAGADLAKVDRSIGKEPAYQAKPKYCLVVYGPEAKTRVWLVLDGDVLYADRNGDGDLTGKDERILKTSAYDVSIAERGGGAAFSLRLVDNPGRDGAETSYRIWCRPAKRKGLAEAPGEPPWLQKTDGVLRF